MFNNSLGSRSNYLAPVLLIVLVALVLRLIWLPQTAKFFFDEATHTQTVWSRISQRQIIYLGPAFLDKKGQTAFLPPFYYYLIAPAITAGRGSPLGAYVETAIFGAMGIGLIFWIGRSLFDYRAGLVGAWLGAVNFRLITIERQLWNPNFLPFFSAAYYLCLWQVLSGKKKFLIPAGFCAGLLVSLHASALLIILPSAICLVGFNRLKNSARIWLGSVGAFLLPLFPWIDYELKNGFVNTKAARFVLFQYTDTELFSGTFFQSVSRSFLRFISAFQDLLFQHKADSLVWLATFVLLVRYLVAVRDKKYPNRRQWLFLLTMIFVFILEASLFRLPIWDYYWLTIFPLLFVVLGVLIAQSVRSKITLVIGVVLVLAYTVFQFMFLGDFFKFSLTRGTREDLDKSENIVLADSSALVDFVARDSNSQSFEIDFRERYFHPGFSNRNGYYYLFSLKDIRPTPSAPILYLIVQPRNYQFGDLAEKGEVLAEKTFGAIKVIKLKKPPLP